MTDYKKAEGPRGGSSMLMQKESARRGLFVALLLVTMIGGGAIWATMSSAKTVGRQTTPAAVAAREISVKTIGHFHVVSHHKQVVMERGSVTGTLSGQAVMSFTLMSLTAGVATCVFHANGGVIDGKSPTRMSIQGANVYFGGSMDITNATGRWIHSVGSKLNFSGYMKRTDFQGIVHISGNINV